MNRLTSPEPSGSTLTAADPTVAPHSISKASSYFGNDAGDRCVIELESAALASSVLVVVVPTGENKYAEPVQSPANKIIGAA